MMRGKIKGESMKGENNNWLGVMVIISFCFAVLSITGFGSYIFGNKIPNGDRVEINVTNYNLGKISAIQDELDNCKASLDQLKNVKEVVCRTPAVEIWQVVGGGIGGVLIALYFIFVLFPTINKRIEDKAEKKIRAEIEAKKKRK
jgi:hypothetical protein